MIVDEFLGRLERVARHERRLAGAVSGARRPERVAEGRRRRRRQVAPPVPRRRRLPLEAITAALGIAAQTCSSGAHGMVQGAVASTRPMTTRARTARCSTRSSGSRRRSSAQRRPDGGGGWIWKPRDDTTRAIPAAAVCSRRPRRAAGSTSWRVRRTSMHSRRRARSRPATRWAPASGAMRIPRRSAAPMSSSSKTGMRKDASMRPAVAEQLDGRSRDRPGRRGRRGQGRRRPSRRRPLSRRLRPVPPPDNPDNRTTTANPHR